MNATAPIARPPATDAPRPVHQLLADIEAGADSLQVLVSRWRPMLPRLLELIAAESTLAGLARLLRELQRHLPEGGAHG